MQSHEIFLIVIYESLRIHQFDYFLRDGIIIIGSDPVDNLMAMDALYSDYCDVLLICPDEPSQVCAIFMEETEAYL